jgi:hypothetical protein
MDTETAILVANTAQTSASTIQLLGAAGFGAIIGWYVYYVNRYRKGGVQFSDITTVIGIIGGGAVVALFPERSDLFGAYGIGLFLGFFGYYFVLSIMVAISPNFDTDWFLDGRRRNVQEGFYIPQEIRPTVTAMDGNKERTNETD